MVSFAGLDFIEGQGEDFERALESTGEFLTLLSVFTDLIYFSLIRRFMVTVDLIKLSEGINTNGFTRVAHFKQCRDSKFILHIFF